MRLLKNLYLSLWRRILADDSLFVDRRLLIDQYPAVYTEKTERIVFEQPSGRGGQSYCRELSQRPYVLPPAAVHVLPNAKVHGLVGMVECNERFILEPSLGKKYYLDRTGDSKFYLTRRVRRRDYLKGTYVLFSASVANNYFMWICYFLPLIRLLQETLGDSVNQINVLLGSSRSQFQLDSLRMLGFTNVQFLDGNIKRIENLYVPTFQYLDVEKSSIGHYNILSRNSILWINKSFQRSIGDGKKIIISRAESGARRILNEELLIENFSDFEVIHLEKMTFADQVALFNLANVVIAPHGAGLTNLVFGSDIKVFEFYPNTRPMNNPKNLQICEYLGHDYHLMILEAVNEHQDMNVSAENIKYIQEHL